MVNQTEKEQVKQLLKLAERLLIEDSFEDAEAVLKKVIKLDATNPEAYYLLGEALCKQGLFLQSVKTLQKADRLLPDHPRITHLLGWTTFMNGDAKTGRALMMRSQKQLPNEISTICDLAVLENQQGNGEKAKEYALMALSIAPENPMAQEVFQVVTVFGKLREKLSKKSN